MSEVTNIIFSFSIIEDEKSIMDEVNKFPNNGRLFNLVSAVDEFGPNKKGWYGGTKYLETPLYIAAINHLALDAFIDYLLSFNWIEPENVQVILQEQSDDKFRIIELTNKQRMELEYG